MQKQNSKSEALDESKTPNINAEIVSVEVADEKQTKHTSNHSNDLDLTPNAFMMYSAHAGTIFSNLSALFVVISLALLFSGLLTVLVIVCVILILIIMIFAMILSIGTIFAIFPNYLDMINSVIGFMGKLGDFVNNIRPYYASLWPIAVPLSLVFATLSLVLLSLDKTEKHTQRKMFSICILGIAIFILVAFILSATGVIKI